MEIQAVMNVVFFLACLVLIKAQDVIVTIDTGTVRGTTAVAQNGTVYNRFFAIPYAQPPIGELRFMPPQPPSNWSGIRDALTEAEECAFSGRGSEDCLYINVYAPINASNTAVIVFLYGGAFDGGSSGTTIYGPDFLVEHGVVLVDMNFRSGPIGLLSLQTDELPGNAGLKDQLAALQWVQRNIAAFGGDPTRVTLFGHSSGAQSAAQLFISPAAAGLFTGVILMSGQANSPLGLVVNPRDRAIRLAASMGFESDDDAELAAFFRSVDAYNLTMDNSRALSEFEQRCPNTVAFGPVIEPESDTAIVWEDPTTVLKEGRFNHVPLLTGVASADGNAQARKYLEDPEAMADLNENFAALLGTQLFLPTLTEQLEAGAKAREFYFGDEDLTADNSQPIYDVFSDAYWFESTEKVVRLVANLSTTPVFYYYYDYNGTGCYDYGCPHASEVQFIFKDANSNLGEDPEAEDTKQMDRLVTLWTNFAKYGEPAPNGVPYLWEAYTPAVHNYMDMKGDFVQRQDLLQERMDFCGPGSCDRPGWRRRRRPGTAASEKKERRDNQDRASSPPPVVARPLSAT